VDREHARRNLRGGLLLGAAAAGIFALSFLVAMLYIAA
jgi:hypothetical protein